MGQALDLVTKQQTFITTLQDKASTSVTNATNAAVDAVQAASAAITVPAIAATTAPAAVTAPPVSFSLPSLVVPTKSYAKPTFDVVPTIGDGITKPLFDAKYVAPTARNQPAAVRPFTAAPPTVDTNLAFPAAPGYVEYAAPDIADRTAPTAGDSSVGVFGAIAPSNFPVAPTNLGNKFVINYKDNGVNARAMASDLVDSYLAKINPQYSAQMSAIEAQITKYLAGGTGLKPEIEDAIYARARAKNDVEAKRVQDAALADSAARGFTLPPGALMSAMARARQDAANNNAKQATDIAVAQAEMEQKNLQFAVTTSATIRKSMLDSSLAYMQSYVALNGQAIQIAKEVLQADIEIYNNEVKTFTLRLDEYKAESAVYELKSRIAMNAVELYKAQIQAYSAVIGADKSKIDIYRSKLEAQSTAATLYKSKVDAVVSQASLQRLKVDIHQATVQAYAAEVQAKNAEWQGYQAAIEGDLAAVKVFSSQVQAYEGQVGAYRAQITADVEKVQALSARNSAMVQQYTAEVGAFEAELRSASSEHSSKVEVEKARLVQYQGTLQVNLANAHNALESYKVQASNALEVARATVTTAIEAKRAGASAFAASASIHDSILKVYSGPIIAAAGSMNALASINGYE